MDHKLGINVVGYLPYDDKGRCDDFLGIEGWEGAEDLGGAVLVSFQFTCQLNKYAPRTRHECIFQQEKLGHNAQDIEMWSIRKEEIPQM